MTRRALLDDTYPGTATETTYTYERTPCKWRSASISQNYQFRPVGPHGPHGLFSYSVHRWQWNVGTGPEIGVATGDTPHDAMEKARGLACNDLDTQTADPSPVWWRGAERVP